MARYWLSCPFLIIVIFSRLLFIVTINEWFMQLVLQDFDPINCIALQFVCLIHAVWIVLLKISKKEPSSLCVKSLYTFFFYDFFEHLFISVTLAKVKICKNNLPSLFRRFRWNNRDYRTLINFVMKEDLPKLLSYKETAIYFLWKMIRVFGLIR